MALRRPRSARIKLAVLPPLLRLWPSAALYRRSMAKIATPRARLTAAAVAQTITSAVPSKPNATHVSTVRATRLNASAATLVRLEGGRIMAGR